MVSSTNKHSIPQGRAVDSTQVPLRFGLTRDFAVSGLVSGTDPNFPLELWDKLLPQCVMTLNLLRRSRVNPKLSAYAMIHGSFDFNKTPLAPAGTKVVIHVKADVRPAHTPHGVDGYYLGPAMEHYRCYRVWAKDTRAERITDTLAWFPWYVNMPSINDDALMIAALNDITRLLKQPVYDGQGGPVADSHLQELRRVASIFDKTQETAPEPRVPSTNPSEKPSVDALEPRVSIETASVSSNAPINAPSQAPTLAIVDPSPTTATTPATTATAPRTGNLRPSKYLVETVLDDDDDDAIDAERNPNADTSMDDTSVDSASTTETESTNTNDHGASAPSIQFKDPIDDSGNQDDDSASGWTYINRTRRPAQRRRNAKRAKKLAVAVSKQTAEEKATFAKANPLRVPPEQTRVLSDFERRRLTDKEQKRIAYNRKGAAAGATTRARNNIHKPSQKNVAYVVIDEETGEALEFRHLIEGKESDKWEAAMAKEIGRLTQGCKQHGIEGTDTMKFISYDDLPADRKATYSRIVASIRNEKADPYRVRITAGGDKIDYPGDVASPAAELTTIKILFNSTISTPGARFMCADISNFYLGTPMLRKEYMMLPMKVIPQCIREEYDVDQLEKKGKVLAEISNTIYGLPQAGLLSYLRLLKLLNKHGYHCDPHTPGLFTHEYRPIAFCLVVDDFGVKYIGREHAEHLMSVLESQYKITKDWDGKRYVGINLKWDYDKRTVQLSMPEYVSNALTRFQHPTPKRKQHAPHPWVEPTYGAKQQLVEDDTTELIGPERQQRLREVVSVFLYYARAVDPTMLVALGSLAARQSAPTEATWKAMNQFLDYAASYPKAVIEYHASGMFLATHANASFLSESKARSRFSDFHFLTDPPANPLVAPTHESTPPPENGAIHVGAQILKNVVSSVAKAELGGAFNGACNATPFRQALETLGHLQPPTPIQTDNCTAAGIANQSIKHKRSKAMDMRFYWLVDRVKQGQFFVFWRRGCDNLADYFTKHHAPKHHRLMRPRYIKPGT